MTTSITLAPMEWAESVLADNRKAQEEREAQDAIRREENRLGSIRYLNRKLQEWGIPYTAEALRFTVGGNTFEFNPNAGYQSRGVLYHVEYIPYDTETEDGDFQPAGTVKHYEDIEGSYLFAAFIAGEKKHNFPMPRKKTAPEPVRVVPEIYRSNYFSSELEIGKWLNEQCAEGYDFHAMTGSAYGNGECGNTAYCVIVRQREGQE